MTPGRVALAGGATAIGNRLAVIGPHLLDLEGRLIDAPLAKFGGMVRRLCAPDGHVNPAGGAVNGHEQIAMRGLVWRVVRAFLCRFSFRVRRPPVSRGPGLARCGTRAVNRFPQGAQNVPD